MPQYPHFPTITVAEEHDGWLVTVDTPGRPMISLTLVSSLGIGDEPEGLDGLITYLVNILPPGNLDRSAEGPASSLERLGAEWRTELGWDGVTIGVHAPIDTLCAAAELLDECLLNSSGELSGVEQGWKGFQYSAQSRIQTLGSQSHVRLRAALFGETRRLGRPAAGGSATTRDLKPGEAKRCLDELRASTHWIVVVGDLDALSKSGRVLPNFEQWTNPDSEGGFKLHADVGKHAVEHRPRVQVIERAGASRAMVRAGLVLPARTTPDYAALKVLESIVGSPVNSRLNKRLRGEVGSTYGAVARVQCNRDSGWLEINSMIRTEELVSTLTGISIEMGEIFHSGVTEIEMRAARRYRLTALTANLDDPVALATLTCRGILQSLPVDYYQRLYAETASLDRSSINMAIARHMNPSRLTYVVEGDSVRASEAAAALTVFD